MYKWITRLYVELGCQSNRLGSLIKNSIGLVSPRKYSSIIIILNNWSDSTLFCVITWTEEPERPAEKQVQTDSCKLLETILASALSLREASCLKCCQGSFMILMTSSLHNIYLGSRRAAHEQLNNLVKWKPFYLDATLRRL